VRCVGGGGISTSGRDSGSIGGSGSSVRVLLGSIRVSGGTGGVSGQFSGPNWRDAFRFFFSLSCAARHPKQVANTLPFAPAEGSLKKEEIGRFWTHEEQYLESISGLETENWSFTGMKLAGNARTEHHVALLLQVT